MKRKVDPVKQLKYPRNSIFEKTFSLKHTCLIAYWFYYRVQMKRKRIYIYILHIISNENYRKKTQTRC